MADPSMGNGLVKPTWRMGSQDGRKWLVRITPIFTSHEWPFMRGINPFRGHTNHGY